MSIWSFTAAVLIHCIEKVAYIFYISNCNVPHWDLTLIVGISVNAEVYAEITSSSIEGAELYVYCIHGLWYWLSWVGYLKESHDNTIIHTFFQNERNNELTLKCHSPCNYYCS